MSSVLITKLRNRASRCKVTISGSALRAIVNKLLCIVYLKYDNLSHLTALWTLPRSHCELAKRTWQSTAGKGRAITGLLHCARNDDGWQLLPGVVTAAASGRSQRDLYRDAYTAIGWALVKSSSSSKTTRTAGN